MLSGQDITTEQVAEVIPLPIERGEIVAPNINYPDWLVSSDEQLAKFAPPLHSLEPVEESAAPSKPSWLGITESIFNIAQRKESDPAKQLSATHQALLECFSCALQGTSTQEKPQPRELLNLTVDSEEVSQWHIKTDKHLLNLQLNTARLEPRTSTRIQANQYLLEESARLLKNKPLIAGWRFTQAVASTLTAYVVGWSGQHLSLEARSDQVNAAEALLQEDAIDAFARVVVKQNVSSEEILMHAALLFPYSWKDAMAKVDSIIPWLQPRSR